MGSMALRISCGIGSFVLGLLFIGFLITIVNGKAPYLISVVRQNSEVIRVTSLDALIVVIAIAFYGYLIFLLWLAVVAIRRFFVNRELQNNLREKLVGWRPGVSTWLYVVALAWMSSAFTTFIVLVNIIPGDRLAGAATVEQSMILIFAAVGPPMIIIFSLLALEIYKGVKDFLREWQDGATKDRAKLALKISLFFGLIVAMGVLSIIV